MRGPKEGRVTVRLIEFYCQHKSSYGDCLFLNGHSRVLGDFFEDLLAAAKQRGFKNSFTLMAFPLLYKE